MSEPRIISPMLDQFALGGAISDRSGVRCYPAMRQDSDERYIVKTISIPATQMQLEALLLTGAYPNAEAARGYFQDLAQGIRSEIEILDQLAARRGFLPFQDSQIVPMAEGVGYEVYLLSFYRRTLERHLKRQPLTHLSAVNLGIDLCAALALCREAGYLYVDLKPSNIFINTDQQTYHLGDLGFVPLSSLQFTALPDRCRSDYTAPEVADAFASLNTTMDIYALGLVLYQIYNNAQLPFGEDRAGWFDALANGETMAPPAYADYEMAEIICKACAYRPEDRYQTPEEMAEALIAYMKRNGANDVAIAPPVVPEPPAAEEEPEPEPQPEPETPEEEAEALEEPEIEEDSLEPEPESEEADYLLDLDLDLPDEGDDDSDEPEELLPDLEPGDQPEPTPDWIDRMDAILSEDQNPDAAPMSDEAISLRELLENDDHYTPMAEEQTDVTPGELSDDTANFLFQIQDLIDHQAPAPAVAPEPIDVPMPEPIRLDIEEEEPEQETSDTDPVPPQKLFFTDEDEEEDYLPQEEPEEDVEELSPRKSKVWKRLLTLVILLLLLAGGAYGGYYYYQNYYLQEIESMTVTGDADKLTVTVTADMDHNLLTVICKDTYGTTSRKPLVNGQATFDQLQPGSQYIISLEISGFHELVNATSASYSTPERTQIVDLNAVTGSEDGSAILSFGVEGPESETWILTCSAPGEEDKVFSFTGHTYTVTGLTPFTTYTFTLTGEDVYLIGENTLTYTVSTVIYAQNLTVTGYRETTMTISWEAPAGAEVNSWTARCYNEDGYEQILVVDKPSATFTEISSDSPYILEITAEGMTQSMRTQVTANPVTITNIDVRVQDFQIDISWTYEGNTPASGWLVLYTADKGDQPQVIEAFDPHVTIAPAAPGSHYDIVIQTADATTVFNGTAIANVPGVSGDFSGNGLDASDISVSLYHAPEGSWDRTTLANATKTNIFSTGSSMAILYYTGEIYQFSSEPITTLLVIRDVHGRLAAISSSTRSWDDMWDSGYCEEEFPTLPATAGDYTLSIYLNGKLLTNQKITITE